MIRFPNAKINLGLNIVSKRDDGYHNLETVFFPIPLKDVVEIIPSSESVSTLTVTGRTVDCPAEKNLVMKAYNALSSQYMLPPVDIYLHKIIPDGAGLGGGSADASTTLLMLNDLFALNICDDKLAAIAKTIGADCPFFIYNKPMLAHGIGDELSPIQLSLAGKSIILIKPDISVSTKAAYAGVKPQVPHTNIIDIIKLPMSRWKELLINDFENSVFAQFPELAEIKDALYSAGAIYASMSGSGSSIFGIFESANMAESALHKFDRYNCYNLSI